jgi:hypothetical protein
MIGSLCGDSGACTSQGGSVTNPAEVRKSAYTPDLSIDDKGRPTRTKHTGNLSQAGFTTRRKEIGEARMYHIDRLIRQKEKCHQREMLPRTVSTREEEKRLTVLTHKILDDRQKERKKKRWIKT